MNMIKDSELEIIRQYYGKIPLHELHSEHLPHIKQAMLSYHALAIGVRHIRNVGYDFVWSESMAYFYGLIASDGNLCGHSNHYTIRVGLHEDDVQILQDLHAFLGTGTLVAQPKRNQYLLAVNNKTLYHKMLESGLTPNKSLTLQWPRDLPSEFNRDFVRGFFDGDGSIFFDRYTVRKLTTRKTWGGQYRAVFYSASKDFMDKLIEVLKLEVGLECCNFTKPTACWTLKLGKHDTIKLGRWLYSDEKCLKMNRKHLLFEESYKQESRVPA